MRWINRIFRVNHIPYYSVEENRDYVLTQGTPAEKRIGMRAQRSKVWEWAGKKHYCLDYTDAEGIDSVRYIFIEDMPHFEPVDMMDLAWGGHFFKGGNPVHATVDIVMNEIKGGYMKWTQDDEIDLELPVPYSK